VKKIKYEAEDPGGVVQLTLDGESFDRCLANFLDEFYATDTLVAA
jgi:hypothetical protein